MIRPMTIFHPLPIRPIGGTHASISAAQSSAASAGHMHPFAAPTYIPAPTDGDAAQRDAAQRDAVRGAGSLDAMLSRLGIRDLGDVVDPTAA